MRGLNMLTALFLLSGFCLTGCNQTASSQQANNTKKPANSENTSIAQSTPEEARRISLVDAKADYDAGSVVIVDTRDADSYAEEHIKGAINIPLPQFENRYQELPKDKQIIAYCS